MNSGYVSDEGDETEDDFPQPMCLKHDQPREGCAECEAEQAGGDAEAPSGPALETSFWHPIETLLDPDRKVLMWTPVENLYERPYTPTMEPEMRVSTKRHWTWATHWRELPGSPTAVGEAWRAPRPLSPDTK